MADYRVLDIETVPDLEAWTPPPPPDFVPFFPDKVAKNSGGVLEGFFPKAPEAFPAPHGHRVVAMSWVDLTADDGRWYCYKDLHTACLWNHSDLDGSEIALLKHFLDVQNNDAATMVTWNGRTFDLPVINMRALKHKLPWPAYYQERDVRYRYTEAGHCDVMDFFTDYGAAKAMKLGEISKLIGLPGKTGPVSGNTVADEFERSKKPASISHDIQRNIARYCLSDSIQTAILFIRSRFHRGSISAKEHNVAVASFAENDAVNSAFGGVSVNWDLLMIPEAPK